MSIMDIVNDNDNSIYYIIKDLPEDTRAAGVAVVKSFGVKNSLRHFGRFFRMTENQASMGADQALSQYAPLRQLHSRYPINIRPLHQRL